MPSGPPVAILLRSLDKTCSDRIHDQVVGEILQVLVSSNGMIVEIRLPESAARPIDSVYAKRRSALGPRNDVAQRMPRQELQHPVNVIRHDDVCEGYATCFMLPRPKLLDHDSGRRIAREQGPALVTRRRNHVDSSGL